MARKTLNKGRQGNDLTKYVGKTMKFYDVKTRENVNLPITHLKRYSLGRKTNRQRSKGRCSVIAFGKRGQRIVPRSLGIFDCKDISLSRRKPKSRKRSTSVSRR